MEVYRASRNTVRRALVITLTSDRRAGAGGGEGIAYAAEVAASGRSSGIPETRVEIMKVPPAVAELLRVPEATEVIKTRTGCALPSPFTARTRTDSLEQVQLQLDNVETQLDLAIMTRYAEVTRQLPAEPPRQPR